MARTVSRTKETNPYESTAITEVRVEGCGAELARACFPDQSLSRCSGQGSRPAAKRAAGRWLAGRRAGVRVGSDERRPEVRDEGDRASILRLKFVGSIGRGIRG